MPAHDEPGVIVADAVYDLHQVKLRAGLGVAALRSARRNGLIVRRVGRKSFVLGSDLIAHIRDNAKIVG